MLQDAFFNEVCDPMIKAQMIKEKASDQLLSKDTIFKYYYLFFILLLYFVLKEFNRFVFQFERSNLYKRTVTLCKLLFIFSCILLTKSHSQAFYTLFQKSRVILNIKFRPTHTNQEFYKFLTVIKNMPVAANFILFVFLICT